ncbi:TPA: hypothetical protein MI381_26935 [Klebsiella pneumoniae]|nr:hypothetical protein [Klebsiella pneumoniae]HBY6171865.1 hypothetical protein [Klebsiella pneumoniae]
MPVKAKLKERIWLLRSSKPVTSVQRAPTPRTFEKTARQGGFFVYRARDYDVQSMISRGSSLESVI